MLLCTTNLRVGTNEKLCGILILITYLRLLGRFFGGSGNNSKRRMKEGNFLYSVIVLICAIARHRRKSPLPKWRDETIYIMPLGLFEYRCNCVHTSHRKWGNGDMMIKCSQE